MTAWLKILDKIYVLLFMVEVRTDGLRSEDQVNLLNCHPFVPIVPSGTQTSTTIHGQLLHQVLLPLNVRNMSTVALMSSTNAIVRDISSHLRH